MRLLRLFFIQLGLFGFLFFSVLFAETVFAQGGTYGSRGLVPCTDDCSFDYLIILIKNITNFLLILAVPVATVLFAYAGVQYIFAAGDTGKIKKAHDIFWSVFIGLLFMASAWLIVKIIVDTLDPEGKGGGGEFLGN